MQVSEPFGTSFLLRSAVSAGREAAFPRTLHPRASPPTHPGGSSHVSRMPEAQKHPGWGLAQGHKVHGLRWVVSVQDSRQPDGSNLRFLRNSAWYFATLCLLCRDRVKGLEMAPAPELLLPSTEWGEGTKPSALGQRTARTLRWLFSACQGSWEPAWIRSSTAQSFWPDLWQEHLQMLTPLFLGPPWAPQRQTGHGAMEWL